MGTSQNLDPRRLMRQAAFCDPQIPQYSAVLENGFPTSQQRMEVLRGTHISYLLSLEKHPLDSTACPFQIWNVVRGHDSLIDKGVAISSGTVASPARLRVQPPTPASSGHRSLRHQRPPTKHRNRVGNDTFQLEQRSCKSPFLHGLPPARL